MKVLLLGLTGSGKSTVSKNIAKKYNLTVVEADDEVIRHNNGIWPEDEALIDKYFDQTSLRMLQEDNVLYVISWMDKVDILKFLDNGFKIIELHAQLEELIKRKINRDNPSEDQINRFKNNYQGYIDVVTDTDVQKALNVTINTTNLTSNEVESIIYQQL
jgi:adenylate kinase family enzyme